MKLKHLSLSVMIMGTAFGLASTQAAASGYQFGSQSVSGQGTAHANGAEANDPSTIFANPAGLSRLEGTQFSTGITLVVPHSEYTDSGSSTVSLPGSPSHATGGGNGGTFAPKAVAAPTFYLSSKINDKITAGIGVFVPYGAKMDYGFDWAGRYALKSVNLQSLNINPSIAFKLDDRHSFGFGVSAQYMSATLEQMADASSGLNASVYGAAYSKALSLGLPASTADVVAKNAVAAAGIKGDGLAHVEGNDWGFGWNIGYMFQLNENTRFGLAYRSSVKQSLQGSSTWTFDNVSGAIAGSPLTPAQLAKSKHPNASASVDITTPETFSANFFHQLDPRWAVMGDVTWVGNSQLKNIDIKQSTVNGTAQGDMVIHQNWKDTWRVSFGANYQLNDAWLLRGGLAWEQSPVQNDQDRHPAIPDSDRLWLSFGANYKINKQSSVDLAYSFIDFKNANVNYTDGCSPAGVSPTTGAACTGNGGTVNGSYKTYLQLLAVQYNYRF
nr:OmpP1/FadL family transporter [Chromobacterium sp. ASV5]